MKYVTLAIPIIILAILMMPYSTLAEIWDSGYDSEISLDRSGVSDSYLIIGRDTISDSYLVIDSVYESPSIYTLTGYSYESILTITNNCTESQNVRYLFTNFPFQALVSGGYVQADGDDITLTYEGATEERLVAMTGTGGDNLILNYYDLPGHSSLNGHLYMGNSTVSRDQWWIGDADDTITVTDHGTLDITNNLTIMANVHLPKNPSSGTPQIIAQKANAYELLINDTPEFIFRVYIGGTPAEVTRTTVSDIDIPVICTYSGTRVRIDTGGGYDQTACAGNIDSNANDLSIVQADAIIDDLIIYSNLIEVINFDFEPEDLTDTTITDLSGWNNHATYILSGSPACVTTSYGSVDFTGEQNVLSPDSNPQSAVGSIDPQLGTNPPSVPEENPDNVLWVISDALADTTGTMSSDGEPRIPITLIATFIYFGALIWVWKKLSMYVRDRFILGMGTMVVTGAFVAMSGGLIHWGLLVFHAIIVIWMFVSERNQQV